MEERERFLSEFCSPQHPYGTPEDLEFARQLIQQHGAQSNVLGVWRVSRRAITNIPYRPFYIPCIWPLACCLLPLAQNQAARMEHTTYIMTDDSLVITVSDFMPPCCSFGNSTGKDYREVFYESMVEINVDNAGRGFACCQVASVKITLQGGSMKHGGNTEIVYCENPDLISSLIRSARRACKINGNNGGHIPPHYVGISPPLAISAPQPACFGRVVRVFVAYRGSSTITTSSSPTNNCRWRIVQYPCGGDFNRFKEVVAERLQLSSTNIRFELECDGASGTCAELENTSELREDDRVWVQLV
eukprot:gnl/Spiro4/15208_TR8194_c0_g1_i1.p1 gnl/Spiro4/15208_TR8194_c0_g1~~gnl/Spiro4/15208_TR8194_c0_g1_i1.p1  ORF type:complete len:312 (+),score=62.97 gnl/Spiro4/15208_TR8194_c0_g1_i1:30-938(+)